MANELPDNSVIFWELCLLLEKLENLDRASPSIVGETSIGKSAMNTWDHLGSMSVDELWMLRENIDTILADKISAELSKLSKQLDRLGPKNKTTNASRKRLNAAGEGKPATAQILPKYQNPNRPFETWGGRGRRPFWLNQQLSAGKTLEEFSVV
jgi:DNA-binding protein H-NS